MLKQNMEQDADSKKVIPLETSATSTVQDIWRTAYGFWRSPGRPGGTIAFQVRCSGSLEVAMQTFVGMILGMLLLVAGVYIYDSMATSTVAKGQVATANRTIVNWDVAETNWNTLKVRAHDDWIKLSSK
jgi:hypothetical protein